MDAAIVLAVAAGAAWALNFVVVRWGLDRTAAPALIAATVGVTVAAAFTLVVALVTGQTAPSSGDIWRFALVGAIAPGSSQGLLVASVRLIGPSRSSVLAGTTPAWSVLLAILFLDEPWQAAIVVGTLFAIGGSALISWEPGLHARRLGVTLALATAVTFGVRDVVARHFNTGSEVSSWWAAAVVLSSGAITLWLMSAVIERGSVGAGVRASLPEFLASGLMIGLALPSLLEALDRGRVGVVSPLSLASQNLTVVVVSAVVFGAHERTWRVLLALGIILAGATLVTTA